MCLKAMVYSVAVVAFLVISLTLATVVRCVVALADSDAEGHDKFASNEFWDWDNAEYWGWGVLACVVLWVPVFIVVTIVMLGDRGLGWLGDSFFRCLCCCETPCAHRKGKHTTTHTRELVYIPMADMEELRQQEEDATAERKKKKPRRKAPQSFDDAFV